MSSAVFRRALLPLGVTGNTPDSGSGESWFDPRRGNSEPDITLCAVGLFRFLRRVSVRKSVREDRTTSSHLSSLVRVTGHRENLGFIGDVVALLHRLCVRPTAGVHDGA